jgi:hypothetical protein
MTVDNRVVVVRTAVSMVVVVRTPASVVVAGSPAMGPSGPPGPPGAASWTHQHTQAIPAAVWGPIAHGLGTKPAAVSLFDATFETQYDEFVVQHLDADTLRIAMDTPTAGVALIS